MGDDRGADTTTVVIDPDRLATLEEERSFLLRSLRDLDAERAAGDIDEHDYVTLRDGYTKRAAEVLRQIDAGRASLPPRREASWARRLGVVAAIVAIAAGAGWLVAKSSGDRLAGDEITGDLPGDGVAAMLAEARLIRAADPVAAMELYGDVLEAQPDHAEALAYSAWLLLSVAAQSSDDAIVADAVETARQKLSEAIDADPTYPDAHCFLSVVAAEFDGDADAARSERATCLALDPPADVRTMIESQPD